jgi:glycosyltransferase involved in cell wall biosynthesis
MKVLYASVDSIQEGVGASQILPLVLRLKQRGINIHLLTFEKRTPPVELVETLINAGIEWRMYEFRPSSLVQAIRRFFIILFQAKKYDFVHARGDFVALAAAFSRVAFLWDIRSFWALQRYRMSTGNLERVVFRIVNKFERFLLLSCSCFSTLTNSALFYFQEKYPKIIRRNCVVPTFVDLDFFRFEPTFAESKVMLFSGTFNELYDFDSTKAFVSALKSVGEFQFWWARPQETTSTQLFEISDLVCELQRSQLVPFMHLASVGISICQEHKDNSLLAAAPTKLAEFLSVGRPIVVNAQLGDFDYLIETYNIGITVRPDGDMLSDALKLSVLLNDPLLPYRCRRVAEMYFDIELGVNRYIDLYRQQVSYEE